LKTIVKTEVGRTSTKKRRVLGEKGFFEGSGLVIKRRSSPFNQKKKKPATRKGQKDDEKENTG